MSNAYNTQYPDSINSVSDKYYYNEELHFWEKKEVSNLFLTDNDPLNDDPTIPNGARWWCPLNNNLYFYVENKWNFIGKVYLNKNIKPKLELVFQNYNFIDENLYQAYLYEHIYIKANISEGIFPYKYYWTADSENVVFINNSSEHLGIITSTIPGKYTIYLRVTDVKNNIYTAKAYVEFLYDYKDLISNIEVSALEEQVNNKVIAKAHVSNGIEPYRYYWSIDDEESFIIEELDQIPTSISFVTNIVGQYTLTLKVKDAINKEFQTSLLIDYTVRKPLSVRLIYTSLVNLTGTPYHNNISTMVYNGYGNYLYQWDIKFNDKFSGDVYYSFNPIINEINYDTNNPYKIDLSFLQIGKYTVTCMITDTHTNNKVSSSIVMYAVGPILINSIEGDTSISYNYPINWRINMDGGTSNIRIFWECSSSNVGITSLNTYNNIVSITSNSPGTYLISVRAEDGLTEDTFDKFITFT